MKCKILIVDDEPNILLSLEFLMKKEGYQVFIARDGEEAFEIIKRDVPHIILLDVMMPKVDGYQVCEFVKNTEEFKDTKVVFLSAKSKESEVKKGLELGASMYISKPFSNKELIKNIKILAEDLVS
jgi:DNA-binding response OmpR family regulator